MAEPPSRRSFLFAAAATAAAVPVGLKAQAKVGVMRLSEGFIQRMPDLMAWANVPGLSVAILKDGKLSWSRGFGVVKAGESTSVTADTIFPAASLSKPVVAYAILRMRDAKLIDLDRPLWNYLPYADLPEADHAKVLTARHALSHSSGLQNWRFGPEDKLQFAFKPGESFQYSGEGFYYLLRVIEHITGRGFEEYMQETVLGPLGMANSTYGWNLNIEPKVTWGHNGRMRPSESFNAQRGRQMLATAEQIKKPLPSWKHEDVAKAYSETNKTAPIFPNFLLPNSAGSLLTSVDQYAEFMARLLRPRGDRLDLSAESRREMLQRQVKINSGVSWGLGVGLEKYGGRTHIWHWGDNGNFKAFMMGDTTNGSGVVVFTNASNGDKMWQRIVTEVMGADHPASYFFMT